MNKTDYFTESILEQELTSYVNSGIYPMHMPGHKRRAATSSSLPYNWDVTEVEGTDDLHHAGGILQQAMERTAALYGSRKTWYLVNGSTCGILAAIRACTHFGGRIVAARNCHRSVYHAIELCGLSVRYIWPDTDPETGLCCSIRPEQVERALSLYAGCEAVILTSPTYEGVLSDIRSIAEICHARDIPLIVDEAHGAHLGLYEGLGFPDGALHEGADLVIQSPHKTLMSLTQTAWMHLGSDRVSERALQRQLSVFETSSPSYPLLTSLDGCSCALENHGEEIFTAWKERLDRFDERACGLTHFRTLWHGGERGRTGDRFFAVDPSKIVILCDRAPYDGFTLAKKLREDFRIETEMAFPRGVLAMTGVGDSQEGILHLAEALHRLDEAIENRDETGTGSRPDGYPDFRNRALCTIAEAADADGCEAGPEEAEGRVSGEYLYCYPPGVPILVPGEVISREVLAFLRNMRREGVQVYHSRSVQERIFCIEE